MGGDLFEILFVVAFILFGILGGRKKKPGAGQTPRSRPQRPPRPRTARQQAGGPGTTQDALLRELEGLLTGRRPVEESSWQPVPSPDVPDPSEARSLETLEVEETAAWEEGLDRAAVVQDTARWMAGRDRGAKSLETLEGAGEASHTRFHQRYNLTAEAPARAEPAARFAMGEIRRAVVWAEILGKPVSMR